MDYKANWTYENIDSARAKHLASCPNYSELVLRLLSINHQQIEFQLDRGYLFPVEDALRPIFYIHTPEISDWFFNGISGYRAQYYSSPETGLKANSFTFSQLERTFVQIAEASKYEFQHQDYGTLKIAEHDFLASLRYNSSKVWGDETEGELKNIVSENQDNNAQIIAERWMLASLQNIQKAAKGIKAPKIEKLKFHGAFIKDSEEVVPLGKLSRSQDINLWGFT